MCPTEKADGSITLDVTLSATTNLVRPPARKYSWDLNGDGYFEIDCVSAAQVAASFTNPGIYLVTVKVMDQFGNNYTDTNIVNVLNDSVMNICNDIWNRVKTALSVSDSETALNNISASSHDMYEYNFNLMQAYLPTISSEMEIGAGDNLVVLDIGDNLARFELRKSEGGVEDAYYIEFVKDYDGVWKLHFF